MSGCNIKAIGLPDVLGERSTIALCPIPYPSEVELAPIPAVLSGLRIATLKYPLDEPPQPQFTWKYPFPSYPSSTKQCPPPVD